MKQTIDFPAGTRRILIAAGFEGTLLPRLDSPGEPRLEPAVSQLLQRLAATPRVSVAVISRRPLAELAASCPPGLFLAGNYGLEIEGRGTTYRHPDIPRFRPAIASVTVAVQELAARWHGAWVEDWSLGARLHYGGVACRRQRQLLTEARGLVAGTIPRFSLRADHRSLEFVPQFGWNKGHALDLLREVAGPFDAVAILAASRGDQPLFTACPEAVHLHVNAAGVVSTLEALLEACGALQPATAASPRLACA